MPFDPENPFAPADPSGWARIGALPQIVVHPKPPPNTPPADGIDDWFVPPPAAPGIGQPLPGAQSKAGLSSKPATPIPNAPAAPPNLVPDYWSLIPASRIGAMTWDPPYLTPFSPSPTGRGASNRSLAAAFAHPPYSAAAQFAPGTVIG
jgi:hypothetical protein